MKFAEFIGYKLMNIIVNNILLLINFWHVLPRDMVKVNIYLSKSPPEQRSFNAPPSSPINITQAIVMPSYTKAHAPYIS